MSGEFQSRSITEFGVICLEPQATEIQGIQVLEVEDD